MFAKKRFAWLLGVGFPLIVMAQPPWGQHPGAPCGPHPGSPWGPGGMKGPHWEEKGDWGGGPLFLGRLLAGIDLPADKKGELDKLVLDHQKRMMERRVKMAELQTKLKLALTSDPPRQKEIEEIATQMGKMKEEGVKMRANLVSKVRELVPPDQRSKFDQNLLRGGLGRWMGGGRRGHCFGCR